MNPLSGTLSALLAALVWGGGDFSGGLAARRSSSYQVLALAALAGLALLAGLTILRGESVPTGRDALLATAAGLSGGVGLAGFYRGLAMGQTALVAPTAAVIGAMTPVIFELARRNPPGAGQLAGFGLALAGIWLVTQEGSLDGKAVRNSGLSIAVFAGVGFGGFFVLLGQVQTESVFSALILARLGTLGLAVVMLVKRREPIPRPGANPAALLAGVMDVGGNSLFLVATRYTRLDVATVLSSLYPAITILLASLVLREGVGRRQWLGAGVCLVAVMLIAG